MVLVPIRNPAHPLLQDLHPICPEARSVLLGRGLHIAQTMFIQQGYPPPPTTVAVERSGEPPTPTAGETPPSPSRPGARRCAPPPPSCGPRRRTGRALHARAGPTPKNELPVVAARHATAIGGCRWGMGGFQGASVQGGGEGGGPTISLVQGKVAALAAMVESNLLCIHSVTCNRVGSFHPPPSNSEPPPPSAFSGTTRFASRCPSTPTPS